MTTPIDPIREALPVVAPLSDLLDTELKDAAQMRISIQTFQALNPRILTPFDYWKGGIEIGRADAEAALKAKDAELEEAVAKAIYEQWADRPGYIAWVDGGNSLKQDDARAIARTALKEPS